MANSAAALTKIASRLDALTAKLDDALASKLDDASATPGQAVPHLEERLTALDSRFASFERTMFEMRDEMRQQHQQSLGKAGGTDDATAQLLRSESNMKRIIKLAFAKYDADASGMLDLSELGKAISELTSSTADAISFQEVSTFMRKYDADGNGELDVDEFTSMVRDLASSGRLQLNEALQRELRQLAAAREDSPWMCALKADKQLQDTMRSLRADCKAANQRMTTRPRARRRTSLGTSTGVSQRSGASRGSGGDDSSHGRYSFGAGSRDSFQRPSGADGDAASPEIVSRGAVSIVSSPPAVATAGWTPPVSPGARATRPLERLRRRGRATCRALPVLSPESRFTTGWALLMAVLICSCAISVPLELAFDYSLRRALGAGGWRAWQATNLAIDCVFIIDICISFRTGFFVDGQLVRDTGRIARQYLRSGFLIDLLGAFPINLVLNLTTHGGDDSGGTSRLNRNLRLLRIIKLNRLLRLSKLSKRLKYVEVMLSFNPSALRLAKLMILMFCCSMWMGCLWWFVADVELASTNTPDVPYNEWQPSAELLQSPRMGPQFAAAFYWGTGFVTATVPNDIIPSTEAESYVTSTCIFIGSLFYAYVIGSMASALSSLDSKKQVCRGKLETVENYLLMLNVKTDLRSKILEYYEYLFTSSQSMAQDLNLLSDLPPTLGAKLVLMMNHKLVVRSSHFFSSLSDHALLGVLELLKPAIFVPNEAIVVEGQLLRAVHFIQKGQVRVTSDGGDERVITSGESFGLEVAEWMLEHEASTTSGTWSSGNGESFSRDASHNGSSADGTDAGSSHRQANVKSHLSATAITYCDLMTLGVRDLASLLARESSWASLAKKDKASFSTERGFAKIRKALTMGSFVGRWSRRTSTGTDAAEPTTPARSGARASCCSNSVLSTGDRSEHDEPAGDAQGPRVACPSRASSMGSVLLALAAREREREAAESSRTEAEVQQSV